MSSVRSALSRLLAISESGRPRSDGIRLNTLRTLGVNNLIRKSRSMKSVPISVELTRFRMSLCDCACSSILIFSSWLTVVSSSLMDCSSSLLVSSSSADDRSSSLMACSSSLDAFSSSVCASYCSVVDRSCSLTRCSSSSRWWTAAAAGATCSDTGGVSVSAGVCSSKNMRKKPRTGSPWRSTGLTVIVNICGASSMRRDSPCASTFVRCCAAW